MSKKDEKNCKETNENFCIEEDKHRDYMLVREDKNSEWLPIYELGEMISLEKARGYFKNFKNSKKPTFTNADGTKINNILHGKAGFLALIMQPECHGIRVYPGIDGDGNFKLMFVGVYKDGTNMTKHTLVFNGGYPCPHYCSGNDSEDDI